MSLNHLVISYETTTEKISKLQLELNDARNGNGATPQTQELPQGVNNQIAGIQKSLLDLSTKLGNQLATMSGHSQTLNELKQKVAMNEEALKEIDQVIDGINQYKITTNLHLTQIDGMLQTIKNLPQQIRQENLINDDYEITRAITTKVRSGKWDLTNDPNALAQLKNVVAIKSAYVKIGGWPVILDAIKRPDGQANGFRANSDGKYTRNYFFSLVQEDSSVVLNWEFIGNLTDDDETNNTDLWKDYIAPIELYIKYSPMENETP